MKKTINLRSLLLLLLVSFASPAFSQQGVPFLSNISIPPTMSNQSWEITQNNRELMFFLNRKGIFSFDGYEWEKLKIDGRPLAMCFHKNLYFSTLSSIGYASQNSKGEYQFHFMEDTLDDFFHSFFKLNEQLFAVGTQSIVRLDIEGRIRLVPIIEIVETKNLISHGFTLNDSVYYILNGTEMYVLSGDGSKQLPLNLANEEQILFLFNHNDNVIFGTSRSRLYSFDGISSVRLQPKDEKYLEASRLRGGISIDSTRFALATQMGGCVIVNSKDLETKITLNYANGLPDDEIFALAVDGRLGLWMSHAMGITRAELSLPLASFHHLEGLAGSIHSVAQHGEILYLGTSEGVFHLVEEKDFKAIEVTVKPKPKPRVRVQESPEAEKVERVEAKDEEVQKKRRGFFSRIFDRSDRKEDKQPKGGIFQGTRRDTPEEPEKELEPVKRLIYSLQSVTHRYKKLKGVDGRCWQLMNFNETLLAVTSTGLYEISNDVGRAIIAGVYSLQVSQSVVEPNKLFLSTNDGVWVITKENDSWQVIRAFSLQNEQPLSVVDTDTNVFYVSTELGIYRVNYSQTGYIESLPIGDELDGIENPIIRLVNGQHKVITPDMIYSLCIDSNSLNLEYTESRAQEMEIIYSQREVTWLHREGKWISYLSVDSISAPNIPYLALFDDINDIFLSAKGDAYIVNGFKQVFHISSLADSLLVHGVNLYPKRILDSQGNKLNLQDIVLDFSNNGLKVRISAPFYLKEKSVEFRHYISGIMNDWSEWSANSVREFPYLPNGRYVISIEARDIFGNTSEVYQIPFRINPPFWKTPWFIALCIIVFLASIVLLVRLREKQLIREKRILEQRVKARTQTIQEQKDKLTQQRDELTLRNQEILQQKEEIEAQRDEIEAQRDQIFKQNEDITKSIEYAKRIQTAVMPSNELIDSLIPEYYLIFRPRDIVSGDFYWVNQKDGKIVIVVADCTGHGVPGAFMSMLGVSFLNEIVTGGVAIEPHQILNSLRSHIKSTLSQTGKEGENRDGMDMVVCVFDPKAMKLQFAGAYNPMYHIRRGELTEYKPDKMPVGIHLNEKDTFTMTELTIERGDQIFMFSDGFIDQFGGPEGRKYMSKPFKRLLTSISNEPIDVQKSRMENEIDRWIEGYNQVDDIVILGVRF